MASLRAKRPPEAGPPLAESNLKNRDCFVAVAPRNDDNKIHPLTRKTHQTIKKVTDNIESGFKFNTAISAVMELVNDSYTALEKKNDLAAVKEAAKTAVLLLSPFTPHICEQLWQNLGNNKTIFKQEWPKHNKDSIKEEQLTIPVQINGKLRSKVIVPFDIGEEELKDKVFQDEAVKKWLMGKQHRKIIVIPKRLVNIVV